MHTHVCTHMIFLPYCCDQDFQSSSSIEVLGVGILDPFLTLEGERSLTIKSGVSCRCFS